MSFAAFLIDASDRQADTASTGVAVVAPRARRSGVDARRWVGWVDPASTASRPHRHHAQPGNTLLLPPIVAGADPDTDEPGKGRRPAASTDQSDDLVWRKRHDEVTLIVTSEPVKDYPNRNCGICNYGQGPGMTERTWIRDRLKTLGKTQKGLADVLGLPPPRITLIIQGGRRIHASEIFPLASYLELTVQDILSRLAQDDLEGPKLGIVNVIGAVEAGVAVPTPERPRAEWYASPVHQSSAFSAFPQFGLEVLGSSANLIYPPGSVINCVRFADLKRAPQASERVVVYRRLPEDQWEVTVRELRQAEDGSLWLWFMSDDPRHQTPIRHDDPNAEIVALVISSLRPENVRP